MKIVFIGENPTVRRLVELSAAKAGMTVEMATWDQCDLESADFVVAEYEALGEDGISILSFVPAGVKRVAVMPRNEEVPDVFDLSIRKPFLPTELVELFLSNAPIANDTSSSYNGPLDDDPLPSFDEDLTIDLDGLDDIVKGFDDDISLDDDFDKSTAEDDGFSWIEEGDDNKISLDESLESGFDEVQESLPPLDDPLLEEEEEMSFDDGVIDNLSFAPDEVSMDDELLDDLPPLADLTIPTPLDDEDVISDDEFPSFDDEDISFDSEGCDESCDEISDVKDLPTDPFADDLQEILSFEEDKVAQEVDDDEDDFNHYLDDALAQEGDTIDQVNEEEQGDSVLDMNEIAQLKDLLADDDFKDLSEKEMRLALGEEVDDNDLEDTSCLNQSHNEENTDEEEEEPLSPLLSDTNLNHATIPAMSSCDLVTLLQSLSSEKLREVLDGATITLSISYPDKRGAL